MLDGSYSGMRASIADTLNRSDIDTTSTIPSNAIVDAIAIAESDLNRKLAVRQMTALATLTATSGTVALPADFISPITVYGLRGFPMDQMDPNAFAMSAALGNLSSSNPSAFAVIGTNLALYPAPSASLAIPLLYLQRIPPLAANPTGNWLSRSSPDAYLYGALTALAPFLQDDDRLPVWGGLYANVIESITLADQRMYGARLTMTPSITDNRRRFYYYDGGGSAPVPPSPPSPGGGALDFSDSGNSDLTVAI